MYEHIIRITVNVKDKRQLTQRFFICNDAYIHIHGNIIGHYGNH